MSSAGWLAALTFRSAGTTRNAPPGASNVALEQVRITPRPHCGHTRIRLDAVSYTAAQWVQKWVSSALAVRPCTEAGCTRARCLILAPLEGSPFPWERSDHEIGTCGSRCRICSGLI